MAAAAFSSLLKKVLVTLSEGRIKQEASTYGSSIYAEIKALRASFQELETNNHAKDAAFTQRFSERWNTFFSAFMHLSPRESAYKKIGRLHRSHELIPLKLMSTPSGFTSLTTQEKRGFPSPISRF